MSVYIYIYQYIFTYVVPHPFAYVKNDRSTEKQRLKLVSVTHRRGVQQIPARGTRDGRNSKRIHRRFTYKGDTSTHAEGADPRVALEA